MSLENYFNVLLTLQNSFVNGITDTKNTNLWFGKYAEYIKSKSNILEFFSSLEKDEKEQFLKWGKQEANIVETPRDNRTILGLAVGVKRQITTKQPTPTYRSNLTLLDVYNTQKVNTAPTQTKPKKPTSSKRIGGRRHV